MRAAVIALTFLLAGSAVMAEETPDCRRITETLASIEGYQVTVPPAGPDAGWCVLDGARFRSKVPGWPDFKADRLRLRLSATDMELDLQGLRASADPSDREIDDRVRSLLRLRSADLRLSLVHDPEAEVLTLSGLRLEISGGTVLELDAEMRGADLSPGALASGAVTRAALVWRNDGRLPGPVMDLAGQGLAGASGPAAIEAARAELARLVDALPGRALDDPSREALAAGIGALPQGRGKLTLTFVSQDGIGAARLAVATLSGDLLAPEGLAALLDGATVTATWQPGLAP